MSNIRVLDKGAKLKVIRGQTDIAYHDKMFDEKDIHQFVIGENLYWFRGSPTDPDNPDTNEAIETFENVEEFKAFTSPSAPSWNAVTDLIQAFIDNVTASGNTKVDGQIASSAAAPTTASGTYVDMPGITITTKDLGENGHYVTTFDAVFEHSTNNSTVSIILDVDGVEDADSERTVEVSAANALHYIGLQGDISSLASGQIIKVKWKTNAATATVRERTLHVTGFAESNIVA